MDSLHSSPVSVKFLVPGGPAASCKSIEEKDELIAVDHQSVSSMSLEDIHVMIGCVFDAYLEFGNSLLQHSTLHHLLVNVLSCSSWMCDPQGRRGDCCVSHFPPQSVKVVWN